MSAEEKHIEVERFERGCGVPLQRVIIAFVAFYLIAALLNADGILKNSELMKYGRKRDFCLALAQPLANISHKLRFNQPRKWIKATFMSDSTE